MSPGATQRRAVWKRVAAAHCVSAKYDSPTMPTWPSHQDCAAIQSMVS